MVLDTNILIYYSKPGGDHLSPWVMDPSARVSIITRIETLGFPRISHEEKAAIKNALAMLPQAELSEPIVEQAIALRQERKMGLADSIIAATALEHGKELVTRNVQDFEHIVELRLT